MRRGDGATESFYLAAFLLAVSAFFAYRQRRDRRRRDPGLPAADRKHYARQDTRRLVGSAAMAALAVMLPVGVRIDVRAGRPSRLWFYAVWVLVVGLLALLLALAAIDWLANLALALRQRKALADERVAMLKDFPLRRTYPHNGDGGH